MWFNFSPQDSPQQLTIGEGFAEAKNSVFVVITSVKILQRWLFPSNIYIQFTIFNAYFPNKITVYKQEISLAHAREVSVGAIRNQIYYIFSADLLYFDSSPFSSFTWQWNQLCFYVIHHHIDKIQWHQIFKQLLFCFILLPFLHLLLPKKNKTCDINQKLFI